ncbi:MAG: hypothetical protein WC876_05245 [Candidatus Thermoplasmatota archaeon]|jgi:hypothetical protein
MEWVWYVDRGTALVSYPVLLLAAFTGIAAAVPAFGPLHRAAKKHHTAVSVLSALVLFLHAGFGVADTLIVATGNAPVPGYGIGFLIAGAAVGVGAFIILIVATLAFLDPRRFERPWSPRVVHAFAYAGFALATIHAAAIGTDVDWWMAQVAAAALGLLAVLALARLVPSRRARPGEGKQAIAGTAEAVPPTASPEPVRDPSP